MSSDSSGSCLSIANDYDPTSGGTSLADDTSFVFAFSSVNTTTQNTSLSLSSNSETKLSLTLTDYDDTRHWCMGAADIILSPPTDLGTSVTSFSYLPGSGS